MAIALIFGGIIATTLELLKPGFQVLEAAVTLVLSTIGAALLWSLLRSIADANAMRDESSRLIDRIRELDNRIQAAPEIIRHVNAQRGLYEAIHELLGSRYRSQVVDMVRFLHLASTDNNKFFQRWFDLKLALLKDVRVVGDESNPTLPGSIKVKGTLLLDFVEGEFASVEQEVFATWIVNGDDKGDFFDSNDQDRYWLLNRTALDRSTRVCIKRVFMFSGSAPSSKELDFIRSHLRHAQLLRQADLARLSPPADDRLHVYLMRVSALDIKGRLNPARDADINDFAIFDGTRISTWHNDNRDNVNNQVDKKAIWYLDPKSPEHQSVLDLRRMLERAGICARVRTEQELTDWMNREIPGAGG